MALDRFQQIGVAGIAVMGIAFAAFSGSQMGRSEGATSGQISVHVAGAVQKPGVFKLSAGSNVQDAINAAGGTIRGADLAGLNLAEPLVEGTKIEIAGVDGMHGLMPSLSSVASPEPKQVVASVSAERSAPNGPISLSKANQSELDKLPGIGPATARKIIEYRNQFGPFKSVDDLLNVKGIGPKKLDKIRPHAIP